MRRKKQQTMAMATGQVGQVKRYQVLPPAPKKKKSLRRRFGWVKTVIGVALALWFANFALPEGDREKIIEMAQEAWYGGEVPSQSVSTSADSSTSGN